jgi:tryptophan synthase
MDGLKATFAQCKKAGRSALVTYVTAGYPTAEETPDIMLAMEAGGAGMRYDHACEAFDFGL